jgi:hypothetical protein
MPTAPITTPANIQSAPVLEINGGQGRGIERLSPRAVPQKIEEEAAQSVLDQGRHQRAENARQADRDRVGQRKADVADGDVERRAADAVSHAEEERDRHGVPRRFGEHLAQVRNRPCGAEDRQQEPTKGRLREPVRLPRPALDSLLRRVTGRRREGPYGVERNAQERIGRNRNHHALFRAL